MDIIKSLKEEDIYDGIYAQHTSNHEYIYELKIIDDKIYWLPIYERSNNDYMEYCNELLFRTGSDYSGNWVITEDSIKFDKKYQRNKKLTELLNVNNSL